MAAEPTALLTRDAWRDAVLARDGHACVRCGRRAPDVTLDAHHLMERRLFSDGGYRPANGVTVCSDPHADGSPSCHMLAEMTLVSPDELRTMAGIDDVVLPEHLSADTAYDKWGNPTLKDGTRAMGELFWEEPVQKILREAGVLSLFRTRVRYPRTRHLPWSPSRSDDDIALDTDTCFAGREVVVTEKLDGEATTIGADYVHARSLDSGYHPGRTWVRALQGRIGAELPAGWRVCGENLQARHAIEYRDLPDYFFVYSIWDERNCALSWDETTEWAALLDLPTVPVIWRGQFSREAVQSAVDAHQPAYTDEIEGYVVRTAAGFSYADFGTRLAKWVRPGWTAGIDGHWMTAEMVPNELAGR